ncbi:glycosyltransferase family 4 protein [Neobacillus mesonae]|nr:glycosyltransferase family 4 protein [Neobacillus mesonae]
MLKPKLMLFSHISSTVSITGAEKLLLSFLQQMQSYYDCVLVVPSEGIIERMARERAVRVLIQPYELLHYMYMPYEHLREDADKLMQVPSSHQVLELLRAENPHMVITNTCVNVVPAMAARALGIPVIWKLTEMIQSNPYTEEAVRFIDEHSDWVIAISHTVAEPLRQSTIPSKLTILSPTWNDSLAGTEVWDRLRMNQRNELGLTSEHCCVGYISSFIFEAKGLKPFVESALLLCQRFPHTRFWIIGKPVDLAYYEECLSLIQHSGCIHQFLFTEFIEDVSRAYSAMDIAVIPSLVKEGFGMTALESLYFGKPVVAFHQGGLAEMMESVGNGHLLVTPGDTEQLAATMAPFIIDRQGAEQAGHRNHEEAARQYSPAAYSVHVSEMTEQWRSLFPDWFSAAERPKKISILQKSRTARKRSKHRLKKLKGRKKTKKPSSPKKKRKPLAKTPKRTSLTKSKSRSKSRAMVRKRKKRPRIAG